MRSVVSGGCGFIGSALTRALVEAGDDVIVLDDLSVGRLALLPEGAVLIEADICDSWWYDEIRSFEPDRIFHLAAMHFIPQCNAHPAATIRTNVLGTQSILTAARGVQILVLASSAAVYGIGEESHRESEPLAPTDIYGLSKKMSEEAAALWSADTGTTCRAARLFNVYGPNETNPHLIPEILIQTASSTRVELGNLETKRDYIHVSDAVAALLLLSETTTGLPFDTYNVATGSEHSARDVVRALDESQVEPLEVVSVPERYRASDRFHLRGDVRKLTSLGWRAKTSLSDGLRQLAAEPRERLALYTY